MFGTTEDESRGSMKREKFPTATKRPTSYWDIIQEEVIKEENFKQAKKDEEKRKKMLDN